jgi:hypothetical protein
VEHIYRGSILNVSLHVQATENSGQSKGAEERRVVIARLKFQTPQLRNNFLARSDPRDGNRTNSGVILDDWPLLQCTCALDRGRTFARPFHENGPLDYPIIILDDRPL